MKIEKISDNQIRCILTKEDLESRDIKLSELTYGSEKARKLFREMMTQAFRNFGFSTGNLPLMIEAVPTKTDQLILLITKVDDPEELDTRFSRFTQDGGSSGGSEASFDSLADLMEGADDVLNQLLSSRGIRSGSTKGRKDGPSASGNGKGSKQPGAPRPGQGSIPGDSMTEEELYQYTRFYLFHDLEDVISASRSVGGDYAASNTLFRNPEDGEYYLLVRKEDTTAERFNQICNALSEYGLPMDYTTGTDEFFREHMKVIVDRRAVQSLRTL